MRLSSKTDWLRTLCLAVPAALLAGQPAADEAAVQVSDDPNPSAWQAAINQQIDSTYQNYNDAILAERRRLDQLQAQRESLGGQGQR